MVLSSYLCMAEMQGQLLVDFDMPITFASQILPNAQNLFKPLPICS